LIQGRFVAAFGKGNQLPGFVAAIVAQGSLTYTIQSRLIDFINFFNKSQSNRPVAHFFPFVEVEHAGSQKTCTVRVRTGTELLSPEGGKDSGT